MESQPNDTTPVTDAIETIIAKGRVSRAIGKPGEWHKDASRAGVRLSPEVLVTTGQSLLREMSYADVESYIREAKHGDPDALVNMRRARRLFIVARDSMILGMDQNPPVEFDPLFTLCRSLGEVADTNGGDKKAIKASLRNLECISSIPLSIDEVASRALLSSRIRHYLHTKELTSRSAVKKASHSQYHSWRKGFRRIANTYTVHAADTGEPEDEAFAIRGVALNNHYGHINDGIKLR